MALSSRARVATLALALIPTQQAADVPAANDFTPQPQVPYRTPEEFLKTVELPEGYSLELVLSEPQIKEPVAIAFDPDGAMYLAEMRTYMQDIDGTDEITPRSVVSKHVSSKGDGDFDRHSVYLENVLLPRMILPLDDRILLGITNTLDLTVHRDRDQDGKADESKLWFEGGPRGGNMEHQPSGLVWGLDNWIYTTYNAFLPEPVGRLIRRAVVSDDDGATVLSNPHPQSEFIRSTDLCFRPLNMTTGPDGCLYIVDMYRGIIQEGNWVCEGSYLRKVVAQHGFQNNVGRGRVWRLVHKDFKPGPQPRMLRESPAEWVRHLAHPNGWWRDTAQRLLIIKGDKSVVPALTEMFQSHADHLARIHALWTLEGLGCLTPELVRAGMKDSDPRLKVQAIRASETLLKAGDASLVADIRSAGEAAEPRVKLQSVLTAKLHKFPEWKEDAVRHLVTSGSVGLKELGNALMETGPTLSKSFNPEERKQLERGRAIYQEVCFACHGPDGLGAPIPGLKGQTLAPPMAGSRTVRQGDAMLRVLLHGLEGPIDGKTYESQMIPQGNNSDAWMADITSYVRNSFGNAGEFVTAQQVAKLRKETASRAKPWTIDELRALSPQPMPDRTGWKLSASHNPGALAKCTDGDPATRWDTAKEQVPGMWLQIELPTASKVAGIEFQCAASANDSPRNYEVEGSLDGKHWKKLAQGEGRPSSTVEIFSVPASVRFLKVHQKGRKPGKYWSIHELTLLAPPGWKP